MLAAESDTKTVVVTYGKHSKTLAVVRSIGRSGRRVVLTDDDRLPLCAFSRYCDESVRTRSPRTDPAGYLDDLGRICRESQPELVIPMDDTDCDALTHEDAMRKIPCPVALPRASIYATARSKFLTQQLAERLGVESPRTILIEGGADASRIEQVIGFPSIVKPVHGSGSRGFRIIKGYKDLLELVQLVERHGPLVAQEFIPYGGSIGVSYLMNHGELRAKFSHRRIIEFPSTGGPSVVRESIVHPEAEAAGQRLLQELRWHGVAMVEFRLDARTGRAVMVEINPRFWGSLQLAIVSGVDFPRLLIEMYENGDVVPVTEYRAGVKCVKLLPAGVASFFGEGGIKRAGETMRHALDSRCFDVESVNDPLPMVGSALTLARNILSRSRMREFYSRSG